MATKYTFYFSDTAKTDFSLYPYTANGPVSPSDDNFIPQAVAKNTTLKLYGKGMQDYGEGIEQNLIYMLENFANSTRPVRSIEGQLWYNNVGLGSPPSGPELFIRNSNVDDSAGGPGWDAVILSSGTSQMVGDLILSGIPTNTLGAVPLQYIDGHITDATVHITSDQNIFLDALNLDVLNLPVLLGSEVNQLIGVTSLVQTQLNTLTTDKINKAGDTMLAGANLTFNGGEILGLPVIPTLDDASASKKYVDDQILSGSGGDGVLSATTWTTTGIGSPAPDVNETTLQFTISYPALPNSTLIAEGVSRVGHLHLASEVTFDNTGSPPLFISGATVQDIIENIDLLKAPKASPIFTGLLNASAAVFAGSVTVPEPTISSDAATKNYVDSVSGGGGGPVISTAISAVRSLEILTAPVNTPTPYEILAHVVDDNKLSIFFNGIKQFAHTHAIQRIRYDLNVGIVDTDTYTGLDNTLTYDFAINIDGGGPTTVTIPAGSSIDTHGNLITTINNLMTGGSPILVAARLESEGDDVEKFSAYSSGSASSLAITDPVTANTYLFSIDPAPTAILGANFVSDPSMSPTSTPDDIIISGDVTANFPVGKAFSIRGSSDLTYGDFDSIYKVHVNGSTFDGSDTTIPVAWVGDETLSIPLFGSYIPPATPPAPTSFGNVHFTPIGGFDQIGVTVQGTTGDYSETDISGTVLPPGDFTGYVVFDFNIPSGTTIENVLLG